MWKMFFLMMNFMIINLFFLMFFFLLKNNYMKEFNIPFECGFNTLMKCQIKFPMNTLNFMFMFLFLDMEIILFIPFMKEWMMNLINSSFYLILLLIIMTMKFEWENMFLKWNL